MAKKYDPIRQVHEFVNVGPDDHAQNKKKADTIDTATPDILQDKTAANRDNGCASYSGPRDWRMQWFGPFYTATPPAKRNAGTYLIYVGNYPLFVSSSANIEIAIARHLVFSANKIIPIDLLGREVLHYAQLYRQPLSIKTALLFEDDKVIDPKEHLHCYRRAAAAIAYCHAIPCNKYARQKYEFDSLSLTNTGKYFPLLEQFKAEAPPPENDA